MWQFNWGVFWAVLAASVPMGLLIVWLFTNVLKLIATYLRNKSS